MKIDDIRRKADRGTLEVEHLLQAAVAHLPGLSAELQRLSAQHAWRGEELEAASHVPLATWAAVICAYSDAGLEGLRKLAPRYASCSIGLLKEIRSAEAVAALLSWWPDAISQPASERTLAWRIAAALNLMLSFKQAPQISDAHQAAVRQFAHDLYLAADSEPNRATALLLLRGVGDEQSLAFASSTAEFSGAWSGTKRNVIRAIQRRVGANDKPVTVRAEVGGLVDRTSVTLAVYGDSLDPTEVTKLLGVEPTGPEPCGPQRLLSAAARGARTANTGAAIAPVLSVPSAQGAATAGDRAQASPARLRRRLESDHPMTRQRLVQLSKLLAMILRHQPQQFGITLDAEGYAPLTEVLAAVRSRMPHASAADVRAVVATLEHDKRRFSILDDEIRANYGHSLAQRIEHQPAAPPTVLLHGTSRAAVPGILERGLLPMRRQYVHLTTDPTLATRIGARHGPAQVLVVAAAQAFEGGIVFYRANESFWLADAVPARYLSTAP